MAGNSDKYVEIIEGKAKILFPKDEVFYNPVQVFNRDLSVAVINHYAKHFWRSGKRRRQAVPFWRTRSSDNNHEVTIAKDQQSVIPSTSSSCLETTSQPKEWSSISILDALSASGLRSVRYALEVPLAGRITGNDISKTAYDSITRNIEVNGVQDKVDASLKDASLLMNECKTINRYDVIDLDPYGSPTRFLDSAVQACHDGGLLCVTATDAATLCGNHSEKCFTCYGSMSYKSKYCHEMALRIILASIESHANRYGRYILPLLSCSIDFYFRLFVLVFTSPSEAKKSPCKLAMVYHCNGCGNYHFQPLGKNEIGKKGVLKFSNASGPPVDRSCDNCGHTFKLGGPLWIDPIHDKDFLKGLVKTAEEPNNSLKNVKRIEGMVAMAIEELPDSPLFHVLDDLCGVLHCDSIKMAALRSAILDQGYSVSVSHCNPTAIKTDAPHHVIWDIMKCWVKLHPVKELKSNSASAKILQQEPKLEASFRIRNDAVSLSKVLKLTRFPENPEPNWGPKAKAKAKRKHIEEDDCDTRDHGKPKLKVPPSVSTEHENADC